MWGFLDHVRARRRFHDYQPQPVTLASVNKWIGQFERCDRRAARQLLRNVIYLSEAETRRILVDQNAALMERLRAAGLPARKWVYVQVHDAGSSSPVMLNMLREAASLQRLGCCFLDSRDSLSLNKVTNKLGEGALIYVDDFAGSGDQFCSARDFAIQNVVGSFAEFLLIPSICEEAIYKIADRGIEAFAGHVHAKAERPLHDNCNSLDSQAKQRLRQLCHSISPKMPLGYQELATMVVLYRSAPNSIPAIFRGNRDQKPFAGIFPRTIDLPLPK